MGIFDFFRKKKQRSALDLFDELSKDSNTAVIFYKFAYDTLPTELFVNPNKVIQDYYKRGKTAVFATLTGTCLEIGQLFKREEVDKINIEILEKEGFKFFIINLPEVLDNIYKELYILTPISVAIVENNTHFRLFILGIGFPGKRPTLREVDKHKRNMNLGYASGKNNENFIHDIIEFINNDGPIYAVTQG